MHPISHTVDGSEILLLSHYLRWALAPSFWWFSRRISEASTVSINAESDPTICSLPARNVECSLLPRGPELPGGAATHDPNPNHGGVC